MVAKWECPICHCNAYQRYGGVPVPTQAISDSGPGSHSTTITIGKHFMCKGCSVHFGNPKLFCAEKIGEKQAREVKRVINDRIVDMLDTPLDTIFPDADIIWGPDLPIGPPADPNDPEVTKLDEAISKIRIFGGNPHIGITNRNEDRWLDDIMEPGVIAQPGKLDHLGEEELNMIPFTGEPPEDYDPHGFYTTLNEDVIMVGNTKFWTPPKDSDERFLGAEKHKPDMDNIMASLGITLTDIPGEPNLNSDILDGKHDEELKKSRPSRITKIEDGAKAFKRMIEERGEPPCGEPKEDQS